MTGLLPTSIIKRSASQVSTFLNNEAVILGMEKEEYYSLNAVGARVWSLIEEPRTVRQLLTELLRLYNVESGKCEQDLVALLSRLVDEGLIEIESKP